MTLTKFLFLQNWRAKLLFLTRRDLSTFELYIEVFLLSFIFLNIEKPTLPPGVSQKDADMYKEVREKAAMQLLEITKPNLANSPSKLTSATTQQFEQERCPAAIEFGKYEIETWYSSPFPQEYARYVINS